MDRSDRDQLAEAFEAQRGRLRAVAYRILGSTAEAEDAVQEAWLRLTRTDADAVQNLAGFLTTTVARICLDTLRSRRARGERALDGTPEAQAAATPTPGPEDEATIADSVGQALLVVLDMLTPAERLAFVLHDVFDVPFEQVGWCWSARRPPLGNSPAVLAAGCRARATPRPRPTWSAGGRW